jgi:hypothetical protein
MKRCARCKEEKELNEFGAVKQYKDGLDYYCKACKNLFSKETYKKNPKRVRDTAIKRQYGISLLDYDRILEQQDGRCAICKGDNGGNTLHIDHDHATGRIRGLLCVPCNRAIGLLRDSPIVSQEVTKYLVSHSARGINWGVFKTLLGFPNE